MQLCYSHSCFVTLFDKFHPLNLLRENIIKNVSSPEKHFWKVGSLTGTRFHQYFKRGQWGPFRWHYLVLHNETSLAQSATLFKLNLGSGIGMNPCWLMSVKVAELFKNWMARTKEAGLFSTERKHLVLRMCRRVVILVDFRKLINYSIILRFLLSIGSSDIRIRVHLRLELHELHVLSK